MKRSLLTLFCAALLICAAGLRAEEAKKKYKMLVITQSKGFVHGSVKRKAPGVLAPCEVSLSAIGAESGLFDAECTQDASVITPEKLKEVDIIFFYTTGALPITEPNFTAFQDWIKSGKAFIGAHSATDTFGNFKPYYELINGTFNGHPWGSGTTVTITNHDAAHPATKMFEPEFQWKDEIYQYKNFDPKSVRVLQSLNMNKCQPKMPWHVPVCWVREYGSGRLFYTNLGHNEATWESPKFKEHLLAGIRWALKLEQGGSATPNPELWAAMDKQAVLATFNEIKGSLKDVATPEAVANVEKLAAGDDIEALKKAVGDLQRAKQELDQYNAALKNFEGLKPFAKEVGGDEAVAKLEKLSKDDKNGFKNLIGELQKAKGEKDEAKKKAAVENLAKKLK
jgi:uncharacterized protein